VESLSTLNQTVTKTNNMKNNSLLERIQKTGSIKSSNILTDSYLFNTKDIIPTDVPIINMAFSGDISGGFTSGLTILAGESKTFKTLMSLYCLKAYQEKYKDAICLFYDCEFGVTPQYLKAFGIDTDRVLHIPLEHIEQLKFDIVKKLEEIKRGDKVFILIDSLGNLASKKEVDDAEAEKSVADMTRAKTIRSLLRIITPHIAQKDLPCFVINHVYTETGLFAKIVIPGGLAVTYAANQIFVITKAQEKTGTEVTGHRFTLGVHKSRFVKEKSKFPFSVDMSKGINKYSSLIELALESGHVIKPSMGWYAKTSDESKKYRLTDTHSAEFWNPILKDEKFIEFVKKKFQYGADSTEVMFGSDEVEIDD
jgi:RecA/RadA recombinase